MSQLKVNAQAIAKARSDLAARNRDLRTQIGQLRQIEVRLNKAWDGPANESFHKVFDKDSKQFDEFASLIDKYGNVLDEAKATYEKTESANKELAEHRGP